MTNTVNALYPAFSFQVTKKLPENQARLGIIQTPHGAIETPAFIFCATKAAMKAVHMVDVKACDTQVILSNTYHLMLSPGAERIAAFGGLHKFMGWSGPMLTDSGGFQVFSLGHGSVAAEIKGRRDSKNPRTLLRITEEGALFKSYLDGSPQLLTPEKSIDIQVKLGADLIVVFDECTPFHVNKDYTARSMHRSHRWASRCLEEFKRLSNDTQALYGIIQGGVYPDLRIQSADYVNENAFFGHAIGGSLGANKDQMDDIVAMIAPLLTPDRPIHLLGIGGVVDIFNGVQAGIDTFDCVHPTRLARHGGALVPAHLASSRREHLNLRNTQYQDDKNPIDPDCSCVACQTVSRGYLHYLLKAKELVAHTLLTNHNITFMNRLMTGIREALKTTTLQEARKYWCAG